MADDEPIVDDAPTELEVLTEISNDLKYLIKCTIALSRYQDFEYPTDDSSEE